MHPDLLPLLRCPECRVSLALEAAWRTDGGEIIEGALACGCGQRYAVIDGVPRMLPASFAALVEERHADFFRRHPEVARGDACRAPSVRLMTEGFAATHQRERFPSWKE